MPKLDLSSQSADALAQVRTAQTYFDAVGQAQKIVDQKQKSIPFANLAASEASNSKGIYDEVNKAQDGVIAMGGDPQTVFGGLLTFAAMLLQSAKDRLIDTSTASA